MIRHLSLVIATTAALFAAPAFAGFDVQYTEGSRDDVRNWCVAVDGGLTEGSDYSSCSGGEAGLSLTCDEAGECIKTGFGLAPIPTSPEADFISSPGLDALITGSVLAVPGGAPAAPEHQAMPSKPYVPLPYTPASAASSSSNNRPAAGGREPPGTGRPNHLHSPAACPI